MRQENLKYFALKNLGQEPQGGMVRQTGEYEQETLSQKCLTPKNGETPCPYTLPEGVSLLNYTRKAGPLPVTVCSIVVDVPTFVQHALAELDARLHNPVQIKAGDSVFELLSKLGDCGLELRLEWPVREPLETKSPGSTP